MVAHLVRLKLVLLRNGLRRSAAQLVGMAVGALYGIGALIGITVGVVALAFSSDAGLQRVVLVVGGSVVVLGWILLPLVAFGVDATLDPARFVTFPVPRRRLLLGLGLAGVVGIPGVVTLLGTLAASLVWWRHPAAVLAGAVTALLAVAIGVVGSRAATTSLAAVLNGRRTREVTAFVVLAAVAGGYLLFGRVSTAGIDATRLRGTLDSAAAVLGWTPFGAAWAVPADVAAGAWGTAVLRLLVLVASLVLLVAWWDRALAAALVAPSGGETAAAVHGLGLFGRLPGTPLGAITARCLTYWRRDPRYAMAVAAVPIIPIAMFAVGSGETALWFLPMMTGIMGWSIAGDTSTDGTALWMHVAAPVRGRDDRLARAIAAALVLTPVALVLTVVLGVVTDHEGDIPALLGIALGALATSLGAASVMSALIVVRVQQAGENVFANRQGASFVAVLSQLAGMLCALLLSAPEIALGILAVVRHSAALGYASLAVGVVLGGVLLAVGVRWGGRLLDRRAPRLLQQLVALD